MVTKFSVENHQRQEVLDMLFDQDKCFRCYGFGWETVWDIETGFNSVECDQCSGTGHSVDNILYQSIMHDGFEVRFLLDKQKHCADKIIEVGEKMLKQLKSGEVV